MDAGLLKGCLIKVFVRANVPAVNSLSIDPRAGFVYSENLFLSIHLYFVAIFFQLVRKADKAHFASDKIQIESTVDWRN